MSYRLIKPLWVRSFIGCILGLVIGYVNTNSQLFAQELATPVVKSVQESRQVKEPEFSAAARLQWHSQHLSMRENSPHKNLEWKHIGPTHMSGRVTDIAKPLDQPFTFYVTTASGGVWKTTNEGTSWLPIFDDAPSASWGGIAVDPSDSQTIWIGGGESNIFRSSMAGTGVYKSNDAGKTWVHMGLADTQHIARIVVHPNDSKTVYVAAGGHEYTPNGQRGIFKTVDGGITWEKVLYESDLGAGSDLVIDPSNPDTLYASIWHRIRRPWNDPVPGPGGGIYKTTDAGANWKRVTTGLPPRNLSGRIGIALAASQPNVIYALIDNHEVAKAAEEGELDSYGRPKKDVIKGAEVYRSDDHGETWRQINQSSELMSRLFATYGWVFGQIRVDPTDENTSYIMGVPLLKSTDGGQTYVQLSDRGLHSDHHAMWIDPGNSSYIINGNDGGVNLSYDGGESWKNLENLPVVQFYNVALDHQQPFNVYGSVQDNGSWVGPSTHDPRVNDPRNWRRAPGGEASYHAIDPDDPNTLYCEMFYGSIQRADLSAKKAKDIMPKAGDGEPPYRGQWLAPFVISRHNSRIIYHGMNHVFRSMNRGDQWERISPDLTNYDPAKQGNISFATVSTISESPKKFGVLYAGTDDGRVHITNNSGLAWSEITAGLPKNKWVSRVVASAFDEATVYLTQNGKRDDDFQVYVYRSRDYGTTWEDISKGIPGGPVNVIHEDPYDNKVLYVGTDMGVYVTTDGAKTWHVLGAGLPIAFVHDIAIDSPSQTIVIATHGRGIWKLNIRTVGQNRPPSQPPASKILTKQPPGNRR